MDNNDSNLKSSQQTGGLKLMTVFIAVLALHVVVIGGFTVYHLMSGGNSDADLTTDKTHKGLNGATITDGTLPEVTQTDKSAPAPATATTSPEVATTATAPASSTAPATDASATSTGSASAPATASTTPPAPSSTPVPTTSQPINPTAATELASQSAQTPSGPIPPELVPPAEPSASALNSAPISPAPVTSAPTSSMASGPVHMPPAERTASVKQQIYVVKITDSYKKIAHSHHITVAELKEANHIKGDVLHTGQKLVIPSEKMLAAESAPASTSALDAAPTAPVPTDSAPETTASLVSSTSTSTTPATLTHRHFYTVVKGDTLVRIAHKFGTTAKALMAENGITDPTKLSIGKKLKIPSEESRSARTTTPATPTPSQVQAKENAPTPQLANYVH